MNNASSDDDNIFAFNRNEFELSIKKRKYKTRVNNNSVKEYNNTEEMERNNIVEEIESNSIAEEIKSSHILKSNSNFDSYIKKLSNESFKLLQSLVHSKWIQKERLVFLTKFANEDINIIDKLPNSKKRSFYIQSLLEAFELTKECILIKPFMASKEIIEKFHSKEYLDALEETSNMISTSILNENKIIFNYLELKAYGLVDDCPPFNGMWEYIRLISGSSIQAAKALILGEITKNVLKTRNERKIDKDFKIKNGNEYNDILESMDLNFKCENNNNNKNNLNDLKPTICINWMGGRHHAKKDEASGFCYVNDIVLAILELCDYFDKVLCIDIDVHHGDGTEKAFLFCDNVFHISFHIKANGFFPGTGSLEDIGKGAGKYFTMNIPLNYGMNDEEYKNIFEMVIQDISRIYCPHAIVFVCGADCLSGDPLGGLDLSFKAVLDCLDHLLLLDLPMLVLGGGGYHPPNVSRLAALCTAKILNKELPLEIPFHSISYSDKRTYYITPDHSHRNINTVSKYNEELTKKLKSKIREYQDYYRCYYKTDN